MVDGSGDLIAVPVQTDDVDSPDVAGLLAEGSGVAQAAERRLLHLVRDAASGKVPAAELTVELSALAGDLQASFRKLVDAQDRRDLGFRTMATLEQLTARHVWLYRKIQLEEAFYTKLELETLLRSLISADGYEVYQKLLSVEDMERGLLALSDADLRRALLASS
ncbi:MAG TPA: hypothetical protein VJT33_14890 [bacterium]|nr:hypothetical protein [bacterium]